MTAAMNIQNRPCTSLRSAVLVGIAVVAIGAAFLQRGPNSTVPLPTMADVPVQLSNGKTLLVQQHEVTVAEWNRCFHDGGCNLFLTVRPNWDETTTPATGLSHVDVNEYIVWINKKTGKSYRLPTLSEWSDMAESVLPEQADPLFTDPALTWASTYLTEGLAPRALKPQGSFSVTPEGIADLDGSVWEWTQACYSGDDDDISRCPAFFVGGEHISAMSFLIRDPARGGCAVGTPPAHLGMRLVIEQTE